MAVANMDLKCEASKQFGNLGEFPRRARFFRWHPTGVESNLEKWFVPSPTTSLTIHRAICRHWRGPRALKASREIDSLPVSPR